MLGASAQGRAIKSGANCQLRRVKVDQDHVPRVICDCSAAAINCLFKRLSVQIKWPRRRGDNPLGADVTSAPGVFVRADKVTGKVSFWWSYKSCTPPPQKKKLFREKKDSSQQETELLRTGSRSENKD